MKVLNRPMFRIGGPIKEGIMHGIKEPRQRYQDAGQVFKNVENLLVTDQPRGDVLQGAKELGIGSPYKQNVFKPYIKRTVTKPIDLMMLTEEDFSDDFFRGAGVHDNVWNTAIHNFFIDKYDADVEEIDVIFCVRDHQPHLEISVTKDGKVIYSNSVG